MRLQHYLATIFPGLTLSPPLFYTWPVALRFELNGYIEKTPSSGDPYFAAAVHRARLIYEEAFRESQYIYLVAVQTRIVEKSPDATRFSRRHRGKKRPDLFRSANCRRIGVSRPSGKAILSRWNGPLEQEIRTLRWAECAPLTIDYGCVFEAIANQDFWSRRPQIADDVYFIDPENHVVLHMYDDRGMDVIATEVATLKGLYTVRNTWILDHDRRRIEDMFTLHGQPPTVKGSASAVP